MTATGASWHTKYRPTTWDAVRGQDHVVDALKRAIGAREQQAFLFEGPSGTGKTTLARLCARELGVSDVIEVDAATRTGVDAMREVAERANYISFTGEGKVFVVDECHRLTKQAWESLLKDIEEPPEGVFWFFCTTEGTKVPNTIRSRCMSFALRDVSYRELVRLAQEVAEAEGITIMDDVLETAVSEAQGSPRRMLVNLASVQACGDERQALATLGRQAGQKEAIDLARGLFAKWNWKALRENMEALKDENAESIRIVVFSYAQAVAFKTDDEWALSVMSEFERPCIEQNRAGDLLLRLARLNWKKRKTR